MSDLLKRSGVQAADWPVIARQLGMTVEMQAGVFLRVWKDLDATGPSWSKLAKALANIGGDWYEHASKQAEKSGGI